METMANTDRDAQGIRLGFSQSKKDNEWKANLENENLFTSTASPYFKTDNNKVIFFD